MNTVTPPAVRPATARLLPFLFDRASLEGLECQDSGWDEWDACVAEQDLRSEVERQIRSA